MRARVGKDGSFITYGNRSTVELKACEKFTPSSSKSVMLANAAAIMHNSDFSYVKAQGLQMDDCFGEFVVAGMKVRGHLNNDKIQDKIWGLRMHV
jgi:hypothetical protein